jgi:uncharacterized membrane protein YdbT with pleckstrin-like domain
MIDIAQSEKVIRVVRKHWFVLLGTIILLGFFALIPLAILIFLNLVSLSQLFYFSGPGGLVDGFLVASWLLIVWILAWNLFTDYYLDVLVITDKRILDIKQYGFFRRKSSSFRIDRIQNITVEVKGIIQTFFNFGTIRIETAGEEVEFVAKYITDPYAIKQLMNAAQDNEAEKAKLVEVSNGKLTQEKSSDPIAPDHNGL